MFIKIVVAVLGLVALFSALGIATCVYIGYRVKKKAEQVASNVKKEIAQAQGETSNAKTFPALPCPAVDPAQSQAFRDAAAAASIPLKIGLTLVDVYTNQQLGGRDVEVLKSVQATDQNTVTIQAAKTEPGSPSYQRILCIADLMNARQYETGFGNNMPTTITGSTMFTMPQSVFQDWKAGGSAEFESISAYNAPGGKIRVTGELKGQLSRVEPDDVPYSVIVNGDRKDLPAIHVKGKLGDQTAEAYVLDEPANPITLSWRLPDQNFHLNYLKITFPEEKKIEQAIAQSGCAAVYGIYFDFDSARIRPESDPTLKEISDAMRDNPAWKITVQGHTDNVGKDAYNLQLSQRRASSVEQTLVARYHVEQDRLSSEGYGASKPKASNDTAEGRALNRRVELCRQ